ncbi:hypothetical protein GCM10027612_48420 [Microbispora bryophytorum subsp. camponoti]
MTGPLLRVPADDLTGRHPWGGPRAMVGTNPPAPGDAADAVPVSQVTRTSAQQITADVPERH